jgi:hypothetical protein
MFLQKSNSAGDAIRAEDVLKYNPNHGKDGRFGSSKIGGASRSNSGVKRTTSSSIMDAVRENHGLSITVKGRQPRSGYMVALPGHNKEVKSADFFDSTKGKEILSSYMKEKRAELSQPGAHLGLWHDTAHDEVVLDISIKVSDRNSAISLGKQHDQQAIWDVKNGQEISTGGTGGR